jgi:hypothetical protein
VAYGARLESVLGASPRGFESLSLRQVIMNNQFAFGEESLGLDLAWEVRRLTQGTHAPYTSSEFFDFGMSDTLAYFTPPMGVIAVQFESEYLSVDGELRHSGNNDDVLAEIWVESRYRSVIATGDILCDRENHEIQRDGRVNSVLSIGELAFELETEPELVDDEDMPDEGSVIVVGLGNFLHERTRDQEIASKRLENLTEILNALSEDNPMRPAALDKLAQIATSGERAGWKSLSLSDEQKMDLHHQLQHLDESQCIGPVSNISVVDDPLG